MSACIIIFIFLKEFVCQFAISYKYGSNLMFLVQNNCNVIDKFEGVINPTLLRISKTVLNTSAQHALGQWSSGP